MLDIYIEVRQRGKTCYGTAVSSDDSITIKSLEIHEGKHIAYFVMLLHVVQQLKSNQLIEANIYTNWDMLAKMMTGRWHSKQQMVIDLMHEINLTSFGMALSYEWINHQSVA